MDAEQGSKLDPSVDPNQLIIQQGEYTGAIPAVETSTGQIKSDDISTDHDFIEGLPVIGAVAENESRDTLTPAVVEELHRVDESDTEHFTEDQQKMVDGIITAEKSMPDDIIPTDATVIDAYHDKAGVDAMATEVGVRAEALLDDETSQKLKDQVREAAEARFRAELVAKEVEKQAAAKQKQEAADAKAKELIEKFKSGTPVSEILPETAYNSTDPRNIGLSLGGEDSMF
ncbi:MAG: hypothetical protein WCK26_00750 [Candidatus Saccharibacteria bacterium]